MVFPSVKETPKNSLLTALLQGDTAKVPKRVITHLPVKQAGLVTPNPTLSAWDNWMTSYVVTVHLVEALWGRKYFKTVDQALLP